MSFSNFYINSKNTIYKKRSPKEKIFGLFLFLLIAIILKSFEGMLLHEKFDSFSAKNSNVLIPFRYFFNISLILYSFLAISLWFSWQKISIKRLVFEFTLFFLSYIFYIIWALFFFAAKEHMISLITLLFTWNIALINFILLYRKKKLSSFFSLGWLTWVSYLVGMNMNICSFN